MKILIEPKQEQIFQILEERKFSFSQIEQKVREIVGDMKNNGQIALEKYISMYEKCTLKKEQIVV